MGTVHPFAVRAPERKQSPMANPTLNDVAAHAGVSLTTASMVLGGKSARFTPETQDRVRAAAAALGYERNAAAAALRTGTGEHIAVLMPTQELADSPRNLLFDSPFFSDFFAGFEFAAASKGIAFSLNRISEPSKLGALTRIHRPRAALVLGSMPAAAMAVIGNWDIPTVVVDDTEACQPYRSNPALIDYCLDDARMGFLGMSHLIERGHRKIALLFGKLASSSVHRKRHEGALNALRQAGLDDSSIELIESPDVSFGAVDAVARQLVAAISHGATAILCMADILALGCYATLVQNGLAVPKQVSLCSMDGLRLLSYLPYRLTTVDQRIVERGIAVAGLLLDGTTPATLSPFVREGDTVAPHSAEG